MSEQDDNLEGEIEDVAYKAWLNAENRGDALKILAFTGGLDVETVVRNIANNAPESVVRPTLAGLLLGFLDAGRADLVMETLEDMAVLAYQLGETDE